MRERTNKTKWMVFALLICVTSIFYTSCSKPSVEGVIFLDQNGNKLYDPGEVKLGNVSYEVYIDDKPVRSAMSYDDGFYTEELSKKDIDKNVCIKVDMDRTPPERIRESVGVMPIQQEIPAETPAAPASVKMSMKTDLLPTGDDDGDTILNGQDNCPIDSNTNQQDSDGDKVGDKCDNCDDDKNLDQKDDDGDGVGDECDNCPDHPNEDQEDEDNNGTGDKCEGKSSSGGASDDADKPDTSDAKLDFNEVCVDVDEIAKKTLDRNIPVAYERSGDYGDLNKQEVSVMAGGTSKVWVTYPCSCSVEKFCLPSWVQESAWKGKDAGVACIDLMLNENYYPAIMAYAPASPVEDEDCKRMVDIAGDPELDEEKTEVVNVNVECPDGADHNFELTIKGYPQPPIDVMPSLITPLAAVEPEANIEVRYEVENRTSTAYENVELSISLLNNVTVDPYPPLMVSQVSDTDNCSNMGASVTCVIKKLKTSPNAPASFNIIFQGPTNKRFGEYITKAIVVVKSIAPPLRIDVNNDLGDADIPRAVLLNIPQLKDTDDDGIPDKTDNCKFVENEDQKNTDKFQEILDAEPLTGDVCDDDDNDGVPFSQDNCPIDANPLQIDEDEDGYGKGLCDSDDNDDNVH